MTWTRAGLALVAAGAVAALLVSGGHSADPRTPAALPGLPPPFLGTAVVGNGGLTAAVDAYGAVVDLRAPGPAGAALIENPVVRQVAGTVAADTGIVPRVSVGGGPALPLWRAGAVSQRYRRDSNVVLTRGRFGRARVAVVTAVDNGRLAMIVRTDGDGSSGDGSRSVPSITVDAEGAACRKATEGTELALICMPSTVPLSRDFLEGQPPGVALGVRRGDSPFVAAAHAIVNREAASDRAWLVRARTLGDGAPGWARSLYRRSLLALRALTDRRTGAVAAGVRDGWAYVWPRDAGTAALAYAAAGYRPEADRVSGFLLGLGLEAAARFHGDGSPVAGRVAQGDAVGWVAAAAQAAGSIGSARHAARILSSTYPTPWRQRADYQEGDPGDFLANAIASGGPLTEFRSGRGLARRAGEPDSGLDSAAAWAVRPFPRPRHFAAVRQTLHRLAAAGGRFGIVPGESWPGTDPWTAPTAWSAWSLAALARDADRQGLGRPAQRDRRAALRLLGDLRRTATPAGALPERVDARTGIPVSTTPLAWPHAFTVLALRELWP